MALLAGLGIAAASLTPAAASAAVDGWTNRGVTQHAGPGNQYPRVGYVPGGSKVRVFGCLRGVTQCDVGYRGNRGWVNGRALSGLQRNKRVPLISIGPQIGLPFITFNFGYWDNHYRGKPFFQQRGRWDKNWRGGPRMGDGNQQDRDCKPGDRSRECRQPRAM